MAVAGVVAVAGAVAAAVGVARMVAVAAAVATAVGLATAVCCGSGIGEATGDDTGTGALRVAAAGVTDATGVVASGVAGSGVAGGGVAVGVGVGGPLLGVVCTTDRISTNDSAAGCWIATRPAATVVEDWGGSVATVSGKPATAFAT